jgi:hypothetical protein
MKLYRVEYRGESSNTWLPVTYQKTKAVAIQTAKVIHGHATHPGEWRVREGAVPNRLAAAEWCEVLRFDMLAPNEEDRTVADFVELGDVVAQSKPSKEFKQ